MNPHTKIKTFLLHLSFWLIYISSEYFANLYHLRHGENWIFFRSIFLSLPLLLFPTYFMVYVAVPRFLKNGKWLYFLLSVMAVLTIVFYGRIKWLELINYLDSNRHFDIPASKAMKNIIRDYSIIALAICVYIIGDWRQKQQFNEQLIKAKAEAEIQLLKGQLQPHFLFNSLNNIYSLALMKSDQTAESILKLTELLDFLVYRANMDKVALSKEVDLLQNYIDLEKLRHGEKLKIHAELSILNDSIQVSPLLLLPFAENCFKHGGLGKDGFFNIEIILKVDAEKLLFQIENSKKKNPNKSLQSGGVGLKNIRKRLELLYPNRHRLDILENENYYKVVLELEF